jgi:uncharacterized membrane protein SirB2
MTLAEYYPHIKTAHVALVSASGLLFAVRGAAVLARHAWPLRGALRVTSVAIDSALLAAGVALWSLLALQPLRDPWLGTKLLLLLLYIALGSLALKRALSAAGRWHTPPRWLATFTWLRSRRPIIPWARCET